MPDLVGLLDDFDRVVAAGVGVVPDEVIEEAAEVGARARARRGYLGKTVVVALAGGTGSGKSSLVNALAGEEVAPTGARRPTTTAPLAWIPSNPEPGLVRLIDDLGIAERIGQDELDWLAVIDLPDIDSLSEQNRATVERLLPQVDAIVWVVDPEKYKDRLLHHVFLRPLASYEEQFLFVLNQSDRVDDIELPSLVADLEAALREDGISSPIVIATSADPPLGPPEGMAALVEALSALGEAKEVVTRRLVTDLSLAVDRLAVSVGVSDGGGTGFSPRWDEVMTEAAEALADDVMGPSLAAAAGRFGRTAGRRAVALVRAVPPAQAIDIPPPSITSGRRRAVRAIAGLVSDVAATVEGETRMAVREVEETLERDVSQASDTVVAGDSVALPPPPKWWTPVRAVRWIGFITTLIGAAVAVDRVRDAGSLVLPLVLVIAGTMANLGLVSFAAAAGTRWTAGAVRAHRAEIAASARRELDRRIGRPLRMALRRRAGVGAAVTEFRLALDE